MIFKKYPFYIALILVMILHLTLLLKLNFLPYPELFIYPYLTNHGLLPYKQIFDQHFPGLMFLPLNFNNLGMVTPQIARIWLLGIVTGIHLMLFLIAKNFFNSPIKALLPNILFLLLQPFLEGWVLWVDSFMPLLLLPAFYFTYQAVAENKKKFCFFSGLFLGLAIVFKQQAIPIAGLVFLFLLFSVKDAKSLLIYIAGLLPAPFLMVVYIIAIGVLNDFWYWTITFNLTTFSQYGRKLPNATPESWTLFKRILFIYSPALVLPFVKNHKLGILLMIFIVSGWSGDIARFDLVHFQVSLPFLILGISLLIINFWDKLFTKAALVIFLAPIFYWQINFYKAYIGNKIYFFDSQVSLIKDKVGQKVQPGEEIFIFGPVPHLYQMTNTIPAGKIFVFQFPWFLRVSEDKFLSALQTNPPKIIVRDRTVEIEGQKIVDYAKKLDEHISMHYDVIDRVGTTEIMEMKK